MRHRLPALLVAALLLVTIVAPIQAREPQVTRHQQIVAHWTPARMAAATPRDFVFDSNRSFVPRAKPGGDGTTTGASWSGGGAIKERSGKVYFEMGGGAYDCSSAVATDSRTTTSLVLTAGHCAYDETGQAFATNWLFIHDFAIAVVGGGGHSGAAQLDVTVGAFNVSIPGFTAAGQTSYAFGYPAAGRYRGNDLATATGPSSRIHTTRS